MPLGIKLPSFVRGFTTFAEKQAEAAKRRAKFQASDLLSLTGTTPSPVQPISAALSTYPILRRLAEDDKTRYLLKKAGEGEEWYRERFVEPNVAWWMRESNYLGMQAVRGLGKVGVLPDTTVAQFEQVQRERPELSDRPINLFKAYLGDQEETDEVRKTVEALPLTERILMSMVLDPANLLPIVGFGPEIKTLVSAVRAGGPAGKQALRTLLTTKAFREQGMVLAKEALLEATQGQRVIRPVGEGVVEIAKGAFAGRTGTVLSQLSDGKYRVLIGEQTRTLREGSLKFPGVVGGMLEELPEPFKAFDFEDAIRIAAGDAQAPAVQEMTRRAEELLKYIKVFPQSEKVPLWQQELLELGEKRNALRGTINETVSALISDSPRPGGAWSAHERAVPLIANPNQVAADAFSNRRLLRRMLVEGSQQPVARELVSPFDPSMTHQGHVSGRAWISTQRGLEIADSTTSTATRLLRGFQYGKGKIGIPFELNKKQIERVTGKYIEDVIEGWETKGYKARFGPDEDRFVQLFTRNHLDLGEDMKVWGVHLPDAWTDVMHVFRQVLGKSGIAFDNAVGAGLSKAKPGSMKARFYEELSEGVAHNIDYARDFLAVDELASLALRRWAVREQFMNTIVKSGILKSEFVASELKLARAQSGRRYVLAKWAQNYAHQLLRGKPPKPTLRDIEIQAVPSGVRSLVDAVAAATRGLQGRARAQAAKPFARRADDLVRAAREEHKTASGAFRRALDNVNLKVQDGAPFGQTCPVSVGMAPANVYPKLNAKLFLTDDIKYFRKLWESEGGKLLRAAASTSDVFRVGGTALDPGFWWIQGQAALGVDFGRAFGLTGGPKTWIWGKAMYNSLRSFTNPRAAAGYWAREVPKHGDEFGAFIRHYRVLGSSEFTHAVERGGFLEAVEAHTPILKNLKPLGRAGEAFNTYLDVFAWEAWKALRPLAKKPEDFVELGAMLRNITGKTSTRGLGVVGRQRLIERAFILWAPAFTRGAFAIVFKAMTEPTSFGGRQALRSLAGLGVAATILGSAATLSRQLVANKGDFSKISWDDLGTDMKSFWDIRQPSKFWALRIGDNYYGLGGAYRSLAALAGNLYRTSKENPEDFSPFDPNRSLGVNWDNPFLRYYRQKTSPLTGNVWNVLSGQDYIGQQIDGPEAYIRVTESGLPFGVQAYLNSTGGTKDRIGAGTAEFMGFRSFPVRPIDLYHEKAEEVLGQPWGEIDQSPELILARQDRENFPELVDAWAKYQQHLRSRGSDFQKARDISEADKIRRNTELETLAGSIQWGRPGGGQWYKDQRPILFAESRRAYETALATLGVNIDDLEESEGKDAVISSKLFELRPEQFMGPDNKPDWDMYFAARDSLKAQLTPAGQKASEDLRTFFPDNPLLAQTEQRRLQATDALQAWFDFPKYQGLTAEQSDQIDQILKQASQLRDLLQLSGKSVDRDRIVQAIGATTPGLDPKIILYARVLTHSNLAALVKSPAKSQWALSHPDLAVFYPFIFDTLSEEDQVKWQELYSLSGISSQMTSNVMTNPLTSSQGFGTLEEGRGV